MLHKNLTVCLSDQTRSLYIKPYFSTDVTVRLIITKISTISTVTEHQSFQTLLSSWY